MPTAKTFPRSSSPWRLLLATLVMALAGGLAQTALAAPPEGPPPGMGPGHAGGMHRQVPRGLPGGPGMADWDGWQRTGLAPQRQLGRMLDLAQATPEQRSRVEQIMQAARRDLQGSREAERNLREQQAALLAQPTIDADALEALRQQQVARHDRVSRRLTQALVDAARVLTAEQRQRIGAHRAMLERHRSERRALESRP